MKPRALCVHCGSSLGDPPAHAEAARSIGRALAALPGGTDHPKTNETLTVGTPRSASVTANAATTIHF